MIIRRNRRLFISLLVVPTLLVGILAGPASVGRAGVPPGLVASANTSARVVALTFDDGPSPYTPQILSVLHRFHAHATFFIVGLHVPQFPQYLRQEVRAGDQLGNHTYSHLDLETLSTPGIIAQLSKDQSIIRSKTGVTPHWFRPPYGDIDGRVIRTAASLGLRSIIWSVDPADYSLPGTQRIIDNVVSNVQPGSVVIMHDGGGDRSETVAALPTILQILRSRGYRFATLDQLFGLGPLGACVPNASHIFSRQGIRAHKHHPIYKAWARMLCRGFDLGPATSRERRHKDGTVTQDFRTTAHRLEWRPSSRSVRILIEWGWAASVFSKRHVAPRYGAPITHSWFSLYLSGHNRGAALHGQHRRHRRIVQRFKRGWAIQGPGNRVVWRHHLKRSHHHKR